METAPVILQQKISTLIRCVMCWIAKERKVQQARRAPPERMEQLARREHKVCRESPGIPVHKGLSD